MTKVDLLAELSTNTYLVLKPSVVNGIGVFAIRDIPAGCRGMFSEPENNWIEISKKEITNLPVYARELVYSYCVFDNDSYYVPDYGFKIIDLVNFLNHSESSNIKPINGGEFFEAIREIKAGEELFMNYEDLK